MTSAESMPPDRPSTTPPKAVLFDVVSRPRDQRTVYARLVGKQLGNLAGLRFDAARGTAQNNRIEPFLERRCPESNITLRRHHE